MSFKSVVAALFIVGTLPNFAFGQALLETKKPDELVQATEKLYAENCAKCHDRPTDRIPPKQAIQILKTPDEIIEKLTTGSMKYMAEFLTPADIKTLAYGLSNRAASPPEPDPKANMCATLIKAMTLEDPSWNGWGRDPENTRRQHEPGFAAKDIPKLKVKWAFALPNVAYVQPTPVGGNLFAPSRNGTIFALNGDTGCTYWTFKTDAAVRTAVTIGALPDGKRAAYFADEKGNAYAIDAMTGAQIWKTQVDKHVMIRVVGAPKLYGGLLYVPTSSMEEVAAGNNPKYPCCTFRGSVVAVNAETGAIVWTAHTITEPSKPTQKNDADAQMFGPAGGAVWTSPTIDIKRGLLYVGTGDSYTDVPADGTNAVIAFDLKTGERKWVQQVLTKDNWLMGCPPGAPTKGNCPKTVGPDLDFGSPPILKTLPGGKQVLLAVAKGGTAFAFDPDDNGKILWRTPLGEGNAPGVVWGPAADDDNLYVAMTDPKAADPNQGPGGMYAINIKTGKVAWHTPAPKPTCAWGTDHCVRSQSSAIALITGAVFSGSADGHFRAYDTKTGKLIWDLDVGKTYPGVNGAEAHGGSIDGSPMSIAGGTIYLNSGNVTLSTPQPGNALLALTVDGK